MKQSQRWRARMSGILEKSNERWGARGWPCLSTLLPRKTHLDRPYAVRPFASEWVDRRVCVNYQDIVDADYAISPSWFLLPFPTHILFVSSCAALSPHLAWLLLSLFFHYFLTNAPPGVTSSCTCLVLSIYRLMWVGYLTQVFRRILLSDVFRVSGRPSFQKCMQK